MSKPLRVPYTDGALVDINDIETFIARDNPIAAAKVLVAIESAVELLIQFPEKSRMTHRRGLRALALRHYPYIVFFRLKPKVLEVVHVLHSARRHPGFSDAAATFAR